MNRWMRMSFALGLGLSLIAAAPAWASGGSSSSSSTRTTRSPSYTDSFVAVDTMQVTLIQAARIKGTLVVSIGLDIQDAHLRAEAVHAMPRLRDAYINRLSRHGATRIDPRRVADVEIIRDLLQATTDHILGAEGAEILLMNVLVRAGTNHRGAIGGR